MPKRWVPILFVLSSCAHLGSAPSEAWQRSVLWNEAHGYFVTGDFAHADSTFALLSSTYPFSNEGRESLFYLGVISLDPRNPNWNSEPAEEHLHAYLRADSAAGVEIHRRPEGEMLYRLAHQLNLPVEDRIEALRPSATRTTVVVREPEPVGQDAEIGRLRREVAARDTLIRQLRDDLDRIRKTLTGGQ